MKKLFLLAMVSLTTLSFAQELKSADGRWSYRGSNALMFNQTAFSNWVAGGSNSAALTGRADYEANFKEGKHIWDNRIFLGYGVRSQKGQDSRKTEDIINLTSKYGYELKKSWYATGLLDFKTQFAKGYNYDNEVKDANGNVIKDADGNISYTKTSNFLAPGYLTIAPGVEYRPHDNFWVNFSPLNSVFTFVTDKDLKLKGLYGLENDGDSMVYGLGAKIAALYRLDLMENISMENRLTLFTDYLHDFINEVDVNYGALIDMKINDYLSAQLTFDVLYDEDAIAKTQIKETFGVGLTYKFGADREDDDKASDMMKDFKKSNKKHMETIK